MTRTRTLTGGPTLFPSAHAADRHPDRPKVGKIRLVPALAVLVVALVGVTGLTAAVTSIGSAGATASGATGTASGPAVRAAAPKAFMSIPEAQTGGRFGPGPVTPANPTNPTNGGGGQPARIEETGAITVLVRGAQIQADVDRLTSLAVGSGGFVASTSTQSAMPGSPAQGTVTLQVPVGNFGTVVDEVKVLGKVASLTTSATDVTGRYVNLQAQITALEDSRQQYLTIMTKATTIGGILAVQSQLDNLQDQLDQLQGQLKTLGNETNYSTLAVTLAQRLATPPPPKPKSGLLLAWRAAVSGFVAGCEGVIRVAGPLLFALLLLGALFLSGRLAWRRLARRSGRRQTV
jgi:hypothetical protein